MAEPNSDIPSTKEWKQWRRGMFGDPYIVWHDGADFTAPLQAARSDPQSVVRMLAAGISAGDPLAPESVTVLAFAALAPVQLQAPMRTAIGKGPSESAWPKRCTR